MPPGFAVGVFDIAVFFLTRPLSFACNVSATRFRDLALDRKDIKSVFDSKV